MNISYEFSKFLRKFKILLLQMAATENIFGGRYYA